MTSLNGQPPDETAASGASILLRRLGVCMVGRLASCMQVEWHGRKADWFASSAPASGAACLRAPPHAALAASTSSVLQFSTAVPVSQT